MSLKNVLFRMGALFLGIGLGIGIGVLLAPEKGERVRKKLLRNGHKIKEELEDLSWRLADYMDETKGYVEEFVEGTERKIKKSCCKKGG